MEVSIYSEKELLEKVNTTSFDKSILISIHDPDCHDNHMFQSKFLKVKYFSFYDLVEPEPEKSKSALVNESIVREFIDFVDRNMNLTDHFILHCNAGVGRSPAFGLILLDIVSHNIYLPDEMKEIRPKSMPNKLIIEIYDRITGKDLSSQNSVIWENRINSMKAKIIDDSSVY